MEQHIFLQALNSAFRFLSFRPRSEEEMRKHLAKKGVSEEIAEKVMDRLRELKLVDDLAFARFWRENRDAFRQRGDRLLRLEMRRKGIPAEVINDVLRQGPSEESRAYAAAQKRVRALRGLPEGTFSEKLGNYLARRGFDWLTINTVVRKLWEENVGDSAHP